jgi:hypothetical protein
MTEFLRAFEVIFLAFSCVGWLCAGFIVFQIVKIRRYKRVGNEEVINDQ